jgi:hypothetical protein
MTWRIRMSGVPRGVLKKLRDPKVSRSGINLFVRVCELHGKVLIEIST